MANSSTWPSTRWRPACDFSARGFPAGRRLRRLPATLGEIRAVEVATPLGAACQQAALRLLERDGWVFRGLAGGKPTAKAIERFVAGYEANARGYEADLEKCLALASADERPAVAHLMGAL